MRIGFRAFVTMVAVVTAISSSCFSADKNEKEALKRQADEKLLQNYNHLSDILYKEVDGQQLEMVLFLPPKEMEGPYPVMLHTHGGGWTGGGRFKIFAKPFRRSLDSLLNQGVAVASIEYRLAKSGTSGVYECAVDCMDSARYLIKHAEQLNIDPDKMGVWGGSAGGHLSLLTGLADPHLFPGDEALAEFTPTFRVVVSYYPATTLLEPEIVKDGILKVPWRIKLFVGGTLEEHPEMAKLLSPVTHLKKDSPPVLLLHGDKDPALPVSNSHHMAAEAKTCGAEVDLLVVKNAGHVFQGNNIIPSMEEINDRATAFILGRLK